MRAPEDGKLGRLKLNSVRMDEQHEHVFIAGSVGWGGRKEWCNQCNHSIAVADGLLIEAVITVRNPPGRLLSVLMPESVISAWRSSLQSVCVYDLWYCTFNHGTTKAT